ncbi:hypothetical protein F4778DRAFT_758854 [Xylariomycetidae sp. FL2044]|nr:hypothetical protein F4778DRAFT_758854 [Xylariomycetidae sp. FL2044]
MTSLSVAEQFRMIDAAIDAGVRRYVPSEYGLNNNMRPDSQALNSVSHDKGESLCQRGRRRHGMDI